MDDAFTDYDILPDDRGYSVVRVDTGETVRVDGVLKAGLTHQDAHEAAFALHWAEQKAAGGDCATVASLPQPDPGNVALLHMEAFGMHDHRDLYTPDVLGGLKAIIAAQQQKDPIATVVNTILREWMTERGFLPYQKLPPGEVDQDA